MLVDAFLCCTLRVVTLLIVQGPRVIEGMKEKAKKKRKELKIGSQQKQKA
jgi:hypothetical protein